ncbi:MAG: energy transducer TonB [Bacteroidetes bacterium]|nr:energy transducer TonB [Bacteroidota bacterium]
MKSKKQRIPDLNELAFSGRNKAYGSYLLRKKYPKYLVWSFIFSFLIFLFLTITPYLYYFFDGADMKLTDQELYTVEYNFIPSPEEDLAALAKLLARPPVPVEQVPVVVDSVVNPKGTKPSEEKPEEKVEDQDLKTDSTGSAKGQSDGKGSQDAGAIFTTLDVYPKYPGGDQARLLFLRSSVKYPALAVKMGVQGEVMVLFVVEVDGSISNVSVTKGIGSGCDEEAIRVTQGMPRWEPGKRSGRAVRVLVRMPIVFKFPGLMKKRD